MCRNEKEGSSQKRRTKVSKNYKYGASAVPQPVNGCISVAISEGRCNVAVSVKDMNGVASHVVCVVVGGCVLNTASG